jgi:hypothetical protein
MYKFDLDPRGCCLSNITDVLFLFELLPLAI